MLEDPTRLTRELCAMSHKHEKPVLIIMFEVHWSERPTKTSCNTKDELKARITTAFTNLNKETVGKAGKRFRSRLELAVEGNGDFLK